MSESRRRNGIPCIEDDFERTDNDEESGLDVVYPICPDSMSHSNVSALSCAPNFHVRCINECLESMNNCSVSRFPVQKSNNQPPKETPDPVLGPQEERTAVWKDKLREACDRMLVECGKIWEEYERRWVECETILEERPRMLEQRDRMLKVRDRMRGEDRDRIWEDLDRIWKGYDRMWEEDDRMWEECERILGKRNRMMEERDIIWKTLQGLASVKGETKQND